MKLNIKKFQFGGEFASLAIGYTPTSPQTTAGAYAPAIAESSLTSSKSSSSSKDDISIKDVLKVFEGVKGLPIDVDYVIKDFKLMFQDDILFGTTGKPSYSNLVSYYLNNVSKFNALRHGEEMYNKARELLVANNSLDEIAIDRHGRVLVTNEKGDLDAVTFLEYKKGDYQALSNRDLLDLRLTKLPFGDKIYSNMTGVGMEDVIKKINSVAHSFGTSENKLEGYTIKLSNAIKSGLAAMLEAQGLEASAMTVDGLYKNSIITKDLKDQAQYAMKAIYDSLTPQEKTLLSIRSNGKPAIETISNIVLSRTSNTFNFDTEYQASLNPDGSKKESSSKDNSDEDTFLNRVLKMQGGEDKLLLQRFSNGTETLGVKGKVWSHIPDVDKDTSMMDMLTKSGLINIMQSVDGITFGDQKISSGSLNDIMYPADRGMAIAILPCTTDMQGNKTVDLSILDEVKDITKDITAPINSPEYEKALAKGLKEKGLTEYLTGSEHLDWDLFHPFLIVDGYTTDRIFTGNQTDSKFIHEITGKDQTANIANRMSAALSSKEKGEYDIDAYDRLGIFEIWNSWDNIYNGSVYIPISLNPVSALGGLKGKSLETMKKEAQYQSFMENKDKYMSFNPNNSFVQ